MSLKTRRIKAIPSGGAKGGTGKSTTAAVLANNLSRNPENRVLIVETDTQNPDVARSVSETSRKNISLIYADLRVTEGADDFLEAIESCYEDYDYCVISLPGADIDVPKIVGVTDSLFKQLDIELIEFFTMSTTSDSVNLFKKSQENGFGSIASQSIVVLNGFFGKRDDFKIWNGSETRQKYAHTELYLPNLVARTFSACRESPLLLR